MCKVEVCKQEEEEIKGEKCANGRVKGASVFIKGKSLYVKGVRVFERRVVWRAIKKGRG